MSDLFMPTSYSDEIKSLLEWLNRHGAQGTSMDNIEIRNSPGKGLGVFAAKNITTGDVIFTIPRNCIMGIGDALSSSKIVSMIQSISGLCTKHKITAEFMIWILMCEQQDDLNSHFGPYLRTLDRKVLPTLLDWDAELLEALNGTNLAITVNDSLKRLTEYKDIIEDIHIYNDQYPICSSDSEKIEESPLKKLRTKEKQFLSSITSQHLLWARSHYLSRRYSGKFALSYNPDYIPTSQEDDIRNLGSLCPLLDILNHDSSKNWLELIIEGNQLKVISNHCIVKGSEIFYNYGQLPNEMLLHGYGYSVENNLDDGVAIKLMSKRLEPTRDQVKNLGIYYIKHGGYEGIPKELWKAISSTLMDSTDDQEKDETVSIEYVDIDSCMLIYNWLKSKVEVIEKTNPRADEIFVKYGIDKANINSSQPVDMRAKYIHIYRKGQIDILRETIEALDAILSVEEDINDSGDGDGDSDNESDENESIDR